ncbi:hypothetical protein [Agarilytica rhodophyticola]|uniref:hypothetical protein n=1 Tax=Agarilytica rhodophyticola TaxID=1737490 RepID=UPI000B341C7F|nr:hypothetical protein [Agarilytica rhodophyticola]
MISLSRFILVFVFTCAFLSDAYAAVNCINHHTCRGPAKDLVKAMWVYGGSGARQLFVTAPSAVNFWNCNPNNEHSTSTNVIMNDSNVAFEENYALLLAAYFSNADIVLRRDEHAPGCVLRSVRLFSR